MNREDQLLTLLAQGLTVKQGAELMGITQRTAETHARNARARLGARTIAHAVAIHVSRCVEVPCPTCNGLGKVPGREAKGVDNRKVIT